MNFEEPDSLGNRAALFVDSRETISVSNPGDRARDLCIGSFALGFT